MPAITVPVRYYRLGPEGDRPIVEANFDFATKEVTMPAGQVGLVLVDCWDIHPYASHLERGEQICEQVLAPLADACREVGVAVIHAPSPESRSVCASTVGDGVSRSSSSTIRRSMHRRRSSSHAFDTQVDSRYASRTDSTVTTTTHRHSFTSTTSTTAHMRSSSNLYEEAATSPRNLKGSCQERRDLASGLCGTYEAVSDG